MKQWNGFEEVLDFAISEEEAAAKFYTELAARPGNDWMKKTLESFAREELGHKAKLEAIKTGKSFAPKAKKIQDLKIADYLVDIDPNKELDYQSILILAMKKEKAAFRLYSDLAESSDSEELRQTFLALAQEEAKHKVRFEIEYDDEVLKEN